MKRKIYILIGLLILCIPICILGFKIYHAMQYRNLFRNICHQAVLVNQVMSAIETDYTVYLPGEGNYLNERLITPEHFLDEIPRDPFSKTGEPYRYINDGIYPNPYLLISQGPDRDWDIENYTIKTTTRIPVQIGYYWHYDKDFYEKDGVRIQVPLHTYWKLTTHFHTLGDMVNFMEQQSISIYDPTNGIISNGDIIIFTYGENIYSKYTSKLLF